MDSQRPNFLFIMADQLAGPALPAYGHPIVKAPHLDALAAEGVVFESGYCNSPLCAPSRFSMMAGQLPSRIGAYDNAAEFTAATPTFAHYLRAMGYRTYLAGKMHFVGPDQLHGFEERLTTDIYPSDFGWTPDWEHPEQRPSWYHNMLSVVQAGTCVASNQLDYDEEVAFQATRKIMELARGPDERPFLLLVSFTHPHDPYAIPQEYWDRYDHAAIDMPAVSAIPPAQLDPHSRRLREMCAMDEYELTDEHTRNARHAYYGAISYVDDKVGRLLRALEAAGQRGTTIVVFVSDHGDMLGERGLWYKMTFFEWSARVPMIFHAPGRFAPRRVADHASLVDLLPTLVDIASGGEIAPLAGTADGRSLAPLLYGGQSAAPHVALGEYLGEGTIAPAFMLRRGQYKYIFCETDPEQLYDLASDPRELENRAASPECADVLRAFQAELLEHWNPQEIRRAVIASQHRRRLVAGALMEGEHTAWDFQPRRDASKQYMRNHLDLNDLERRARFPAPATPAPKAAPAGTNAQL
jgi:choline-sulfatase